MPVVDGSRLQTGGDGQAEVEFGDGSVARLTPNSSLQFDHLGQDQVQLQQLSGLTYYEFNVGDGHPPFGLQFANLHMQPTANSIVRVGLDAGWDVAVINGSINVQGEGIPPVDVTENQSIRSGADNGAPYTVAQGITGDSWDNWNQDRDQAIAQEAAQQTPVRDGSANPQNENWNDLDADGNWYPVEGEGNVWVPAGVGPGWDPYGSGYWAYYPTFGYTWVSSYPWGWLPYHCGSWNYYSFGWGWSPGRDVGRVWSPVIVVRTHPPGWSMPIRPVYPPRRCTASAGSAGGSRSWTGCPGSVGVQSRNSAQTGSSASAELEWTHHHTDWPNRRSLAGICRCTGHSAGVARSFERHFPCSGLRGRPSIALTCPATIPRAACRPSTPGRLNLRGKSCHRRKALRRARRRGSTTPGRTLPTRLLSRITSARFTRHVRRPQRTIRRRLLRITHRLRLSNTTRLRRRPSTSRRPARAVRGGAPSWRDLDERGHIRRAKAPSLSGLLFQFAACEAITC